MNCIEIIEAVLQKYGIAQTSYASALHRINAAGLNDCAEVSFAEGECALSRILTDVYMLNTQKVKDISASITKHYAAIGRYEKALIKHYLDYEDDDSYNRLSAALDTCGMTSDGLAFLFQTVRGSEKADPFALFVEKWNDAEQKNDEAKKADYLQTLYTRLCVLLNDDTLSLSDLFAMNKAYIEEELDRSGQDALSRFCESSERISAKKARQLFSEKYNEILVQDLRLKSVQNQLEPVMNAATSQNTPFHDFEAESFGLVILSIDQHMYDAAASEEVFWDTVLSLLYHSYRVLDNHRVLAVRIGNILDKNGCNLKWKAYSYIGIYAEHFLPVREQRKFYNPEDLCLDKCAYVGITLSDWEKDVIRAYYGGSATKTDVTDALGRTADEVDRLLSDFENIWYGYTFSDCISVISEDAPQNKEISFIRNDSQLVMIFNKYRHDDRKIPCPDCAGLEISGNSFPELGLRSWECKNPLCPSRSKSNRGKRYSKKSNFMQWGFECGAESDLIDRALIKKWRRDIAEIGDPKEITEMLVRYFSFHEESVLLVNCEEGHGDTVHAFGREADTLPLSRLSGMKTGHLFRDYFENGAYVRRYLDQITYPKRKASRKMTDAVCSGHASVLVHDDCRNALSSLSENVFTAAVTSPPYYNARLYSQWPNLYLYLSDMYEIAKQVYRTMKPGGVYLYNIGDICGNENTAARSNMGIKRILLGAYTVHLFLSAGFELLDNLLWDKGEPQSNRQKNDGKFTPFYQKPMNVYEHMFLFKKPGAPAIVNENAAQLVPECWRSNIVPFSPVIKINSKGENTLGHTAPFPEDIPLFVAKAFTKDSSDIVLEPFAGSGTTFLAAQHASVRAFGVELCDEYVELIRKICNENGVTVTQL